MMTFDEYGNPVEEQQSSFDAAMTSPYAAMFGTALSNIGTIAQGGIPREQPFSAMMDVRQQNAILMDRKFQLNEQRRQFDAGQLYRDVQTQTAQLQLQREQDTLPNPLANMPQNIQEWEMSGAKARGIPFEKFIESKNPHYAQPNYGTSVTQNMDRWVQYNPQMPGETDEAYMVRKQDAFAELARASKLFEGGGGMVGTINPLTGRPYTVVAAGDATDRNAAAAGAKAGSESWGKYDAEWAQVLPGTQQSLFSIYNFTEEMLNTFKSTDLSNYSGLIAGRFGPIIDQTTAYIDTMSSILTVPALAEAKLAPVTVQEWEAIKGTFTDFKRDPEANIGALEAQLALLRPKLALAEDQWKYFQEKGTMEGYARGRTVTFPNYNNAGGIDITDAPED